MYSVVEGCAATNSTVDNINQCEYMIFDCTLCAVISCEGLAA